MHTIIGSGSQKDLELKSFCPMRPLDWKAVTVPPPNEDYPRVADTKRKRKKKKDGYQHMTVRTNGGFIVLTLTYCETRPPPP